MYLRNEEVQFKITFRTYLNTNSFDSTACLFVKDDPLYCVRYLYSIQGVSQLEDITAGGDFLGLCDQKRSYKHVSNFGLLRSYGHF
jgi:hypothetical protein